MKYTAVTIDQNLVGKSWVGKVESVFNAVCNVTLQNNEVLVFADTNLPMMPNGIAINSFKPSVITGLQTGQRLECNGHSVNFGSSNSIYIRDARCWIGKVACSGPNDTKEQLHARWIQLADQVRKSIPNVLRRLTWHPWFISGPLFTDTTVKTIMSLASHHAPHSDSEKLLTHMMGLGPGLTPSGDDFIVGYLAACHAFGGSCAQTKINEIGQFLRPKLQLMTTKISAHYLDKALQGEFVESISCLMSSFFNHNNFIYIGDIYNSIYKHGHSSGLDCCFGVLVGSAQYCDVASDDLSEFLPVKLEKFD